jgi:hypothetical protein
MGDPADPVGRALLAQVALLQDGTVAQVAQRRM